MCISSFGYQDWILWNINIEIFQQLINAGNGKLASMPSGGGAVVKSGGAAASGDSGAPAPAEKKEEKKEEPEEESDDDMGFGLFD